MATSGAALRGERTEYWLAMTGAAQRILVLGGTGMLGHAVVRVLAPELEVHATVRDPAAAERHGLPARLHAFDATRPEALGELLERTRADVAINCIGIVKQLEDASRPVPAITVNSLFPHQLAEACRDRDVRLIHPSTDCVFSGELPAPAAYTEDDLPDARDLYGRSKLLGEVTEGDALTLRTSIIGWELERGSGLLEWAASQAGGAVRGFAGAIFSGLTTTALARVFADLVRDHPELRGLYHVSADPISKNDLLTALDDALDLRLSIERVELPRVNRALDSSRFRAATGIAIPSWPAMISEYAKEPA
jgi:dTDP-4-dehydrorhamnose reductase